MTLASYLIVDHTLHDKKIEALHGDLTANTVGSEVDILVVSAFRDDYRPTPGSLIGALHRCGISAADLAKRKALDLRRDFSCWLSEPLEEKYPGVLRAKRILCFEPEDDASPPERVDHIFRALAPFIGAAPKATSVAMPLVACGDRGVPVKEIVEPLIRSAVYWMQTSPLHALRLVEYDAARAAEMCTAFELVKEEIQAAQAPAKKSYDVFISYCQKNMEAGDLVERILRMVQPDLRIFRDLSGLKAGTQFSVQLDKAIRDTRRVVPLYSPEYLASEACQREFNDAWNLRGRGHPNILYPLYLFSSDIQDPRMKDLQYVNCVEMDAAKIESAMRSLVAQLN